MKKIAFVVYNISYWGGLNQVVANVANELSKKYEVHIISLFLDDEVRYDFAENIKVIALSKEVKRLSVMRRELKKPLKDYVNINKINVVFLEGDYPGFIASTLRFTSKAKLVFHEHGSLMSQWERRDIVFIRFLNSFLTHKTITLTERNKNDYIKKFKYSKKKIVAIPNWIDTNKEYGDYNPHSKKILAVGRLNYEKGFDLLIKIWASIAKDFPDWSIDLYGDGPEKDNLIALAKEAKVEDTLNFMGWQDNLHKVFQDYAFFVMPSLREGFPLILLEVQEAKLPIISFDILTGPGEIIQDNTNGYLVEPYNLSEFGDKMTELIISERKRVLLSNNSRINLHTFSKKEIKLKWIELIESI
ncbi:glycosyltransferase [Eubacteriales bacterium KG125]